LAVMGQTYVGVRPEDKVLGVVTRDAVGKPWSVKWPDAPAFQPINERYVALLGSKKFYDLVDASINRRHFEEDPIYFVKAYLVQKELSLSPRNEGPNAIRKPLTSTELKKALLSLDVGTENEINAAWKTVLPNFTDEHGKVRFVVTSPDEFEFRVEKKWGSFKDMPQETPLKADPVISKKQDRAKTETDALEDLALESQGIDSHGNLETKLANIWGFLGEIDASRLSRKFLKELGRKGSDSVQLTVGLLQFLNGVRTDVKIDAFWNLTYQVPAGDRSWYSRLVERLIEENSLPDSIPELIKFSIEQLSLNNDELISTKKSLASYCVQLLEANSRIVSKLTKSHLILLLEATPWTNVAKHKLLMKLLDLHPELAGVNSLYSRVDADDLIQMANFDVLGKLESAGKLSEHFGGIFQLILSNTQDQVVILRLMAIARQFPELVSDDLLVDSLSRAWTGHSTFENALSAISQQARIRILQSNTSELESQLLAASDEVASLKNTLDEARRFSESLSRELSNAKSAQDVDRAAANLESRLDVIKNFVAAYASIENSVIDGKSKSLELLRPTLERLGVQAIGAFGTKDIFEPKYHTDPNSELQPGDECSVVSAGYKLKVANDIVVLRKALVTKG